MAINTNYNSYSTLFNSYSASTSTNSYNDIYKLINSGYSASRASYGKNTAAALPEKTQDFLVNSKSASESLKTSLNSLLGKTKTGKSSFDEKTATSSNTDNLSIKSIDSAKSTLDPASVDIQQVATSQKNIGDKLSISEKSFSSGTQTFEVEVGGTKTPVSFYASAGDDNRAIQQKMADAINSKKLGITASVSIDSSDSTNIKSSLNLESTSTGINKAGENNFSIRDYSGSNAVAKLGVAAVDEQAKNAKYRVNGGGLKESKSNDVDLGNGVTATLRKATTTEPVKVSMAKDTLSPINKVRELANGFNSLLEAANGNKGDRRTDGLARELSGLSSAYSSSLNRIGISAGKDGYLKIDEAKMKKAAESGDLEKFFTGNGKNSNYGFANRVSRTAENVSSNPSNYANTKSQTNYTSNFNQAKYNSIVNTGLIFNAMF